MELTKEQVKSLSQIDQTKFTLLILSDWLVIIASLTACVFIRNYAVYLLAMILIGSRLHALNFLGHDVMHKVGYRNKTLNNFVGNIFCLAPSLMSVSHYKSFHMDHHRHLNTKDDPELEYRAAFSFFWKIPLRVPNYVTTTLIDLSGLGIFEALYVGRYIKNAKIKDFVIPYTLWGIAIFILVKLNLEIVPIIYISSYMTFSWFFMRNRARFEHIKSEHTHRFKGNILTNYLLFPHNAWCHYEHHEYPSIPCYNLAKARELDPQKKEITFKELLHFYMTEELNPKTHYQELNSAKA